MFSVVSFSYVIYRTGTALNSLGLCMLLLLAWRPPGPVQSIISAHLRKRCSDHSDRDAAHWTAARYRQLDTDRTKAFSAERARVV
jgi:hypothetical protein